jgi:hypothetical protein
MRSSIQLQVLALFALSARVLAVPPACLLNAVNEQDEPSDLSAICGSEAETVQQAIVDMCGDNEEAAQSAFIATCSAAGSSVGTFYTSSYTAGLSCIFLHLSRAASIPLSLSTTFPRLLNHSVKLTVSSYSRLHPHNNPQLLPHRLRLQQRRHLRLHNRRLQQ